jgi:hypothetical protein
MDSAAWRQPPSGHEDLSVPDAVGAGPFRSGCALPGQQIHRERYAASSSSGSQTRYLENRCPEPPKVNSDIYIDYHRHDERLRVFTFHLHSLLIEGCIYQQP